MNQTNQSNYLHIIAHEILSNPLFHNVNLRIYQNLMKKDIKIMMNTKDSTAPVKSYTEGGEENEMIPLTICTDDQILLTITIYEKDKWKDYSGKYPMVNVMNAFIAYNEVKPDVSDAVKMLQKEVASYPKCRNVPVVPIASDSFTIDKKIRGDKTVNEFFFDQHLVDCYMQYRLGEKVKSIYYPTEYGRDIGILRAYERGSKQNGIIDNMYFTERSIQEIKSIVDWSQKSEVSVTLGRGVELEKRIRNAKNLVQAGGRIWLKTYQEFGNQRLNDYLRYHKSDLLVIQEILHLTEEQMQSITYASVASIVRNECKEHWKEMIPILEIMRKPIDDEIERVTVEEETI